MINVNEKKTIIFEEKYNVNINDFSTHVDIDEFIAKKLGKDKLSIQECEIKI